MTVLARLAALVAGTAPDRRALVGVDGSGIHVQVPDERWAGVLLDGTDPKAPVVLRWP